MTSSELILSLIDHYEKCIPLVAEGKTMNECHAICFKHHVHIGICQCAFDLYKIDIYKAKWVETLSVFNYYWGPTVRLSETKENMITSLTFRVEVMKEIIRRSLNKTPLIQ